MFDNKGGHRNHVQMSSYVQSTSARAKPTPGCTNTAPNPAPATAELSRVKVWGCQTLLIPDHTNKNSESLALKFASARKMSYLSQDLISKIIRNEYGGRGEMKQVTAKTNYTLILKAENLFKSIKFSTITLSYFSIFSARCLIK